MLCAKVTVYTILLLVVAVSSAPISHSESDHEDEEHHEPHHVPHYSYEYSVYDPHSDDFKSQKESRHGDLVKGYYQVKEADGSLREVHYTADKHSGFRAEVTRNGQPLHPEHSGAPEHHLPAHQEHYHPADYSHHY